MNDMLLPSNTVPADELIRSMMRREGDNLERNFLRYREVVRDVWRDLNLSAMKLTERRLIEVDKATNSITVSERYLMLASIGIIDSANKLQTLIINKDIRDDIVDVSAKKRCGCECGCNSDLCGLIHNYEAILEDVVETMPDDSEKTFTKITRKIAYPDGTLVMSYVYPIRVYEDGVWTDTIDSDPEIEEICKLEVEPCGCLKDCEFNNAALNIHCNASTIENDFGCTCKNTDSDLTYNFSENGSRIVFPSNFTHDKVLVRAFIEPDGVKNIRVPLLAKPAFLYGLKVFAFEFDDNIAQGKLQSYKDGYSLKKEKLALDAHKCSLKEFYNVITPPNRRMP